MDPWISIFYYLFLKEIYYITIVFRIKYYKAQALKLNAPHFKNNYTLHIIILHPQVLKRGPPKSVFIHNLSTSIFSTTFATIIQSFLS